MSTNTWKKHACAQKCLEEFNTFCKKNKDELLSKENIPDFIEFCYKKKDLKSSTIRSYISSISLILKLRDADFSFCSSYLVNNLLKGIENLEFYKNISKGTRKVMTLPLLKLIGHQIAISDWKEDSKQVFWTAILVAFFGSIRLGEILGKNEHEFNPNETFLWDDVSFREDDSVLIKLKIVKNRTVQGEFIDLFPFKDKECCPVIALKRLFELKTAKKRIGMPVFTFNNGTILTSSTVNSTLPKLIAPHLGEKAASEYKGHSLRAGIPSAIASRPDVARKSDVKMWGRWSSDSYL